MLQSVSMADGYCVVLHTAVGVWTMPGINLDGALAQFNAFARGKTLCGYKLIAMLCADAEHQHMLKDGAKKHFDEIVCERNSTFEEFRTLHVLRRDKDRDLVVPAPVEKAFESLEKEYEAAVKKRRHCDHSKTDGQMKKILEDDSIPWASKAKDMAPHLLPKWGGLPTMPNKDPSLFDPEVYLSPNSGAGGMGLSNPPVPLGGVSFGLNAPRNVATLCATASLKDERSKPREKEHKVDFPMINNL